MSLISNIAATLGLTPSPAAAPAPAGGGEATPGSATEAAPGSPAGPAASGLVAPAGVDMAHVRILSVNDFHGQLPDSTSKSGDVGIGGAATLAAYVARERAANPDGTVFVAAGDLMGASPPVSGLLRHHSTMAVMNAMGLDLATFGNHEFDGGYAEAIRVIFGDDALRAAQVAQGIAPAPGKQRRKKRVAGGAGASGAGDALAGVATAARAAVLGGGAAAPATAKAKAKAKWPGSSFPWVSANVVDTKTGKTILPPYVIREVNGVKVAFIGAVTKDLKKVTVAKGIPNIKALDPATAINRYVPEIQAKGAKAIVVVIHEGAEPDEKDPSKLTGPLVKLAKDLDPEVDAIVSGHSHTEYAATVHGKHVVQAGSYAKALGVIELGVDRRTGQVVAGATRLVRNDEKGIAPDPTVDAMVKKFEASVAPRTNKVVSVLPAPITREKSNSGETALGSLVAEAQRVHAKADVALMNNGGVRQDLPAAGPVTWGTLFGVQPFANRVIRLDMTGAQLTAVLEQMFPNDGESKALQLAGMTVHMDTTRPVGKRIVKVVLDDGRIVRPSTKLSVAANSFIADGGDGFTELTKVKKRRDVGVDLDALVKYLGAGRPVPVKPLGRLVLDKGSMPEDSH